MRQLKTSVAGLALLSGILLTSAASADSVTLKSADGTVNLIGELIEFNGESYTLRTELGDLSVAASRVLCEGDSCPSFEDITADVAIVGSDAIGLGMMPLLMNGYAASMDAEAELKNTADGQAIATLVGDGEPGLGGARDGVGPLDHALQLTGLVFGGRETALTGSEPFRAVQRSRGNVGIVKASAGKRLHTSPSGQLLYGGISDSSAVPMAVKDNSM